MARVPPAIIARLNAEEHLELIPTFLGAHEITDEYREDREGYIKLAQVWLDAASQHEGRPAMRIAPATDNPSKIW